MKEDDCPFECHSMLYQIMTERRLTIEELSRRSGVGPDAISALRRNQWHAVTGRTIVRLCSTLEIGVSELFTLVRRDLWHPIRTSREVTIHLGSARVPLGGGPPASIPLGPATEVDPEMISAHDFRALQHIIHHLTHPRFGIEVCIQEHGVGRDVYAANAGRTLEDLFPHGSHVVLGSPLSNPFSEAVFSAMYHAQPYKPEERGRFPYNFVWSPTRSVVSAFGWPAIDRRVGIATASGEHLVAERTAPSPDGVGRDCALIAVATLFQPRVKRKYGNDDTRTIVAIAGHGAIGTEGGAHVATDAQQTGRLLPLQNALPRMGVVSMTYLRRRGGHGADGRHITDTSLVAVA